MFHDPLGEFSARKAAFSLYPHDARLKVIAELCTNIWYYAEHKFCYRFVNRKDPQVMQIFTGHFLESVMRLCFLLHNDYAPHWHWLPREFRKLPEAKTLTPELDRFIESDNMEERKQTLLRITKFLRNRVIEEGLVDKNKSESVYDLVDAANVVKQRIGDRLIRETFF